MLSAHVLPLVLSLSRTEDAKSHNAIIMDNQKNERDRYNEQIFEKTNKNNNKQPKKQK